MDAVDAKDVALHRETQHLLIAEFIDQQGLQKTGIDDIQRIEGLADGVDSLSAFELHMLEQQLFVCNRRHGRNVNMQQIAYFF